MSRLDAYISRYGDFFAHDDYNNDMTDYFTCVRGKFTGDLGALGEIILHGHAEWVETRDLIRNFYLHLNYSTLNLSHNYVCIGKPCTCNVFCVPTCYVRGGATST